MQRVELDKDIKPISEFRSKAVLFVERVHKTKRPMVITHHGKSAAVLLDVYEYEDLLEKIELLQDIQAAEKELGHGKGIAHAAAKKDILDNITK